VVTAPFRWGWFTISSEGIDNVPTEGPLVDPADLPAGGVYARPMSDRTTGWIFVAAQGVLLVALVLVPHRDDWPTPTWLQVIAIVLGVGGLAIGIGAGLRLGSALTPTPMPSAAGRLTTDGLYRYVRHPIYSGVLLVVVGLVLRSGSTVGLGVGVALVIFFSVKARWEENRLADRYPDYERYAARTPRFVPAPWR
jgi:protein-S-isoprenylcysteine O-methyltransferase Ste14